MKKKTNAPGFHLELHEKLNNPNLTAPLSEADLLQYAVKNGKIDIDVMLGEINDMNKKEILSRHKYAISHCKEIENTTARTCLIQKQAVQDCFAKEILWNSLRKQS